MRLRFILLLSFSLSLFACKEKQNSATTEEKAAPVAPVKVEDSTQTHFSIVAYLHDQWQMKKEDPYTIMKITIQDGKRDSALIPLDSNLWVTMTTPFYASDISDKKYLGWFRVSTYSEDVTETNHLNYAAVSPDTFTQQVDLAVNPVSNNIKMVYIETARKTEGKTITQKLQYRPDDIIQIVEFVKEKDKPGVTKRIDYKFKY